jgi:hypothetical protein
MNMPPRRPMPRPQPTKPQPQAAGTRAYDRRDKAMSDTFQKLREMSK